MLLHVVVVRDHRRGVMAELVLTKHHASRLGAAILVGRRVGPRLTKVHRRGLLVGIRHILEIYVIIYVVILLAVRLIELRHHIVLTRTSNIIC